MATAKAERLLNLVIALVNSPRYRSAPWIRDKVAGYSDAPNDEAFFRTFERDKQELRELGIPVQTPPAGEDGYRIPPVDFALPAMSFTPAEAAALALAGRLWETTALATAGSGALRKIRDAVGAAAPTAAGTPEPARTRSPQTTLLQPRVRTGDPAFAPLYAAVRARRAVTFDYRKDPHGAGGTRRLQPWGLVSFRGPLVRHRVSTRNAANGAPSGCPGSPGRSRPVGRRRRGPPARRTSICSPRWRPVSSGRPTAPRRCGSGRAGPPGCAGTPMPRTESADPPGWDRVTIPLGSLWDTARRIAGQGPDVVVEEPADLVDATVRLLTGTRDARAVAVDDRPPATANRRCCRGATRMSETATDRLARMLALVPYISRRPGVAIGELADRVRRQRGAGRRRPRPADGLRAARVTTRTT